jgi:hypothetical protein
MVRSGGEEAMQTWARAAGAVALGPVGDLLRNLGEVRGQGITRFWNYWAHRWGNAMVYMYGLNLGLNCGTFGVRCSAGHV